MNKKSWLLYICCVVLFAYSIAFITRAKGQSSVVIKEGNTTTSVEYMKWATIDLDPAIGFHDDAPVRIRIDQIAAVSPMVTQIKALVNKTGGYPVGTTSIIVDGSSGGFPSNKHVFVVNNKTIMIY